MQTAISPDKDSVLDPASPHFNSAAWIKSFAHLLDSDQNAAPPRRAGVAWRNLKVYGHSARTHFQPTTGNIIFSILSKIGHQLSNAKGRRSQILDDFEGIVDPGEMLLVLGPPGSGCSTFLRALAGRHEGIRICKHSYINFRGVPTKMMRGRFRGDVLYNAEADTHLAPLTVGDTLEFASLLRVPAQVPGGYTKRQFATAYRDAIMAIFGISHTIDTRVGDNFKRGISGGERKRVSMAEAALTGAKIQCWDNSTRGLDSGNAIAFCETLRAQADYLHVAALVALYQAPESAYDTFDKVIVLYDGCQIYFGRTDEAKMYFEDMGFRCPDRQTTADFLTSMTSPHERQIRHGYESRTPRTAEEFATRWKLSPERTKLLNELDAYDKAHQSGERLEHFSQSRSVEMGNLRRRRSPFTVSYFEQVRLCVWRGWKRLLADPAFTISQLVFNITMGLVLGSGFYDLPDHTGSFYHRGGVIFFALLFNAFASELEVLTLYYQRPVVEKHHQYAFYRQSSEAISSYLMELPYKVTNSLTFNSMVYWLSHLRREPGAYFFFVLTNFLVTLAMSGLYRTIASIARTSHQALVPVALITIGVMIYTGFTIPRDYLPQWSRWMRHIDPISYGFEALLANEFHLRDFPCEKKVPFGGFYDFGVPPQGRTCPELGVYDWVSETVDGDSYIEIKYDFRYAHKWRNIVILSLFVALFFFTYLVAAEFARPPKTRGEILVFRRSKMKKRESPTNMDIENQLSEKKPVETATRSTLNGGVIPKQSDIESKPIFHWEDLCCDIQIKGKQRRILDLVDGWVKPGTTTALMGASGAGKTTLLDALATRLKIGVLTGATMINGNPTDKSFSHKVGYAQQQDLHLETATVREALEFSAILRQSAEIPRSEKLAYVDEVIRLLEMEPFADAIVGAPGEGLNVEQRKRLTIGVELAARPQLLVFLDEPTSGLDSQTSWSVCNLINKLADSGQAILCTIHQPSAMLFSRFDRLLLLQPGGKPVYFGEIGPNSRTVIDYFERNGAPKCPPTANPAEWVLKTTLPSLDGEDWSEVWRSSPEYQEMKTELERLRQMESPICAVGTQQCASQHNEFVASFGTQFRQVFIRTMKHFWRCPTYTWSKLSVTVLFALFLGFSFERADRSLQGIQNQIFAFFMGFLILQPYNKQIMPFFVPQRALYEAREEPSRIYHWTVFFLTQVVTELIWNTVGAILFFFCWYYTVGFHNNTTDDGITRGATTFLFVWQLVLWISTLSQAAIAPIESADLAAVPATFIGILSMAFCGIGTKREQMPGIWSNGMYWISPMNYLASGALSSILHGVQVHCAAKELIMIPFYSFNHTCEDYLGPFISGGAGGFLINPEAKGYDCLWCPMQTADDFLWQFDVSNDHLWRNFAIGWAYIVFNVAAALGLFYAARVPKRWGSVRGHHHH